jgi:ectoine hydroxylase-related dioxygenase (phytanoyl-CoA dioxygenase family)
MLYLNIIKLFYYILIKRNLYILRKFFFKRNFNFEINAFYSDYLLELKKNGYVIIKNFISSHECELIIKHIEKFLIENKELTYHDNDYSDQRIHGAENISENINSFYSNKIPIQLGEYYYAGKLCNLMTMANKTTFTNDNKGSGGGWHRDGLNFQYKAILYLINVDQNNGPFQLILKSNKLVNIFKTCFKYKLNPFNTRIENVVVEKIIMNNKDLLKTITGAAGDLILVDTSIIHRGCPLNEKKRYALTNYYYPMNIISKYKESFKPIVKEKIF